MTETPGIDDALLKVKSSQGRVNESFITDNRALRKKKQKCKYMNVANNVDKSVVVDSMKNEEKNQIVANTRGKSYADIVRYDQHMSNKKDIDFAKMYRELLVCDKSMSSDMVNFLQTFVLTQQRFQIVLI